MGAKIHPTAVVDPGAVIGDEAVIGPHVVVEEGVEVGAGTEVLPGCHLGRAPKAVGAVARQPDFERRLAIGPGCSIGTNAVVYYDVEIGEECLIGDGASVRELCRIAPRCVIGRGVTLDRAAEVGEGTRVMDKSHLTGEMRIGRDVFISTMVASTNDNSFGREGGGAGTIAGPAIEDGAMIGAGASLLPGVVIGKDAIVASGAVVTADVEPGSLVIGIPARPAKSRG